VIAPAFTAALHPVFLIAAALGAVAFVLTLLLKEIPLRQTARTDMPARTVEAEAALVAEAESASA
jgi:hypothetical protein